MTRNNGIKDAKLLIWFKTLGISFTKYEILAFNSLQQKRFMFLLTILTACSVLTMGLDLFESKFHNYSFYFFESFLFSSFWWLFIPLLYAQFFLANDPKTKASILLKVLLPTIIHLFAYPLLVWFISDLLYYHTFSYNQTFTYGLTEYAFLLCAVYTVPFLLYTSFKSTLSSKLNNSSIIDSTAPNCFVTSFIVLDGNKRTNINTKDIIFIASNPPYINIHHTTKKYIHKETLKSISEKIDTNIFVRVHKSTIVNITKVASYRSRLNGDYDLLMNDGMEIRLSRNFASNFRSLFSNIHQDTL